MELDAHVPRPRRLQEARRVVPIERNLGVASVVADRDIVLLGEGHDLLEQLRRREPAGGVIRVVDPHHLGLLRDLLRNQREVRPKAVLFQQRHGIGGSPREHRAHGVDRVRRIRHERHIARVDEAERHVSDAFLRSDQRHDLLVPQLDAEPFCVPAANRLPHLRQPVGLWITMVRRIVRGAFQCVQDRRRRWDIRIPDAETNDIRALRALLRDLAADLQEQVRRELCQPVGELHRP